jgi:hypothetical protein
LELGLRIDMLASVRAIIERAPAHSREELQNSDWVRHALGSAVWGLLTTNVFEEPSSRWLTWATTPTRLGTMVDAVGGAGEGIDAIPLRWREAWQGEWLLRSGNLRHDINPTELADRRIEH